MKKLYKTYFVFIFAFFVGLTPGLTQVGVLAAETNLDACSLLKESNPESVLGEPVGEALPLLQQSNADVIVSQCSYSAKSSLYKSISLLVKYVYKFENPKNSKAFVESQQLDFGDFKFEPHEVTGLGDVAVSLAAPGTFQLWVFWKKHYQMSVVLDGFDDRNEALKRTKEVARIVLNKL